MISMCRLAVRTGVVEVEDVDSLDIGHGRKLLVVA
jgi:hypothetical protein